MIQHDLCLVSKFWAGNNNESEDPDPEDNEVESPFEEVLTKSQKKKRKQNRKQTSNAVVVNTRSRAGPRNYA